MSERKVKATGTALLVIVEFEDGDKVSQVVPTNSTAVEITSAINSIIANPGEPQEDNNDSGNMETEH